MHFSRNLIPISLATGIGIFTGIKIFDPAFRELQVERGKKKTKQGEEGEGIRLVGGEEGVRKEAIGEVNVEMKEALISNE